MLINAKDIKRILNLDATKLCRDGELFGFKAREGSFVPWTISTTSLAMYLKYHPIILQTVIEPSKITNFGDDDMKIVRAINGALSHNTNDENYNYEQLSNIFGVPMNEIMTVFKAPKSFFKLPFLSRLTYISADDVCKTLNSNPQYVEKLQNRHKELLANGDIMESSARHLLMLYSYYKQHGHLV